MKKHILFLLCFITVSPIYAQVFTEYFTDKTLRVDYIFNGNASKQSICLDGLSSLPTWAGRKHHLAELPLQGNGQIVMRDIADGKTIYTTSFSSLFQEWLETEEAQSVIRTEERNRILHFCMDEMNLDYREVLYLTYFEGMSYAQAAEVTGKTVKQITNMVYRGKESLRRLLEREGITDAES